MEQHHRQPTAGSTNFYRRTSSGVTSSYYRVRKSKSSIILCNQMNSLTILCSNWLWVRQSFFTVALDLTRYDNSFFSNPLEKNVSCFFENYARWWEKYLSKHSPLKHTCSWRDKLIVLWMLNRQAKIFLRVSKRMELSRTLDHP